MTNQNQVKRFVFAIISIVLWVFLWHYPRGTMVSSLRWIQVAVGMLLFIIPGSNAQRHHPAGGMDGGTGGQRISRHAVEAHEAGELGI